MVNQRKIFSFKIKHQAKNNFSSDVERTVCKMYTIKSKVLEQAGLSKQCRPRSDAAECGI